MSTEKTAQEQLSKELAEMMERINKLKSKIPANISITSSALREEWPSLESTLNTSGWVSDRKFDLSSLLESKNTQKFKINIFAKEFIEQFNELSIAFPLDDENETYVYKFDFLKTASSYSPELCQRHGQKLQTTLCPVGISEDGFVVLLIAETGQVFASVDTNLRFVANSYQEALEKLNRNEPFQPIEQ